jgi:hypothetical protein
MLDFLRCNRTISNGDAIAVALTLRRVAEAVGDRFREQDEELAKLKAEVDRLKRVPRQSFAQKLHNKKGQS